LKWPTGQKAKKCGVELGRGQPRSAIYLYSAGLLSEKYSRTSTAPDGPQKIPKLA
jgi:hypothetical protein